MTPLLSGGRTTADADGPTIIGDVFIDPTAQVHVTAKLGPNVSIGPGVIIGKGVRVKESIVLDRAEIKVGSIVCVLSLKRSRLFSPRIPMQPYSSILYSIIGWSSKIGAWCRIEGTPPFATSDNISPAANISDLGGTVWTQPTTDLMLPSGQKNQSATIVGRNEVCAIVCMTSFVLDDRLTTS